MGVLGVWEKINDWIGVGGCIMMVDLLRFIPTEFAVLRDTDVIKYIPNFSLLSWLCAAVIDFECCLAVMNILKAIFSIFNFVLSSIFT